MNWIMLAVLVVGVVVLALAVWACWEKEQAVRRAERAAERRMGGLVAWAQLVALKEARRSRR